MPGQDQCQFLLDLIQRTHVSSLRVIGRSVNARPLAVREDVIVDETFEAKEWHSLGQSGAVSVQRTNSEVIVLLIPIVLESTNVCGSVRGGVI